MAGQKLTFWVTMTFILSATDLQVTSLPRNSPEGSKSPLPNFVIFIADDLGIGDVGCFGNDTIKTPNIDKISRDGARLTHHLTAAAICTPSRAAILTGRYPVRMGMVPPHIVRTNIFVASTSGLPPNETTFAEVLQDHGYSNAFIGKWHLGLHCGNRRDHCHHPVRQGFDYFYGLPLTNLKDFGTTGDNVTGTRAPWIWSLLISLILGSLGLSIALYKLRLLGFCSCVVLCLVISVPTLTVYLVMGNLKVLNSILLRNFDVIEQPIRLDANLTQRLVGEGVQFMEEKNKDETPFLLVMSWVQVHTALHTAPGFQGHSHHGRYGDNVEELDWGVGQILDALEYLGLSDNTFVYFSSDNGAHVDERSALGELEGGSNGIYRGGKSMGGMEGGIRVPTVIRWPGRIRPGLELNQATSQMDLFPTMMDIIGAPLTKDRLIDGANILPLLTEQTEMTAHEFLFHYCGTDIHAARYSPNNSPDVWKIHLATPVLIPGTQGCGFICDCFGDAITYHNPPLLYNIARDPGEDHLLDTTDAKHHGIVERLLAAIEEHKASVEHVPDQYAITQMLPRPWLQPCCNFPHCTCINNKHLNVQENR